MVTTSSTDANETEASVFDASMSEPVAVSGASKACTPATVDG